MSLSAERGSCQLAGKELIFKDGNKTRWRGQRSHGGKDYGDKNGIKRKNRTGEKSQKSLKIKDFGGNKTEKCWEIYD